MKKDKYGFSLKHEKACPVNKEMKFLTLCKKISQFKILKTALGQNL